eukprot:gene6798-7014_t
MAGDAAAGPFRQSEVRPTFAQFVTGNSGTRSVVVLDEFEKTRQEVHHSLLRLLQEGKYVDPYSQQMVDCCNTIFLLTTNAADNAILKFWEANKASLSRTGVEPSALHKQLKPLERQIKAAVASYTSV